MDEKNLPESTMNVTVAEEIVANESSRRLIPGFAGRISAALIWDGTDEVRIPAAMGQPRADQMRGTARERLTEAALRICYDSVGTGRSSEKCHEHIGQVKHYSVTEHAAFTIEFDGDLSKFADDLLNHPGLWVEKTEADKFRVTCNLRHAIDGEFRSRQGSLMHSHMIHHANVLAPQIVKRPGWLLPADSFGDWSSVVEPETDRQKWITLYLVGSRGWGNELVRHRLGALSQRSTRYVDECDSEWTMHPLLAAHQQRNESSEDAVTRGGLATDVRTALGSFANNLAEALDKRDLMDRGADWDELEEALKKIRATVAEIQDYARFWQSHAQLGMVAQESRIAYLAIVRRLQPWLESRGVDKTTARKQARGAARGLLGLDLETEIIYSASVEYWLHVLNMRAADAADAEIRLGFAEAALPCLRASRYGDRFAHLELVPAGDGIGRSLRGGGHL